MDKRFMDYLRPDGTLIETVELIEVQPGVWQQPRYTVIIEHGLLGVFIRDRYEDVKQDGPFIFEDTNS